MSLLSKMIRISGRGDDGTAKAISTDNQGNQKILNYKTNIVIEDIKKSKTWVQGHVIGTNNIDVSNDDYWVLTAGGSGYCEATLVLDNLLDFSNIDHIEIVWENKGTSKTDDAQSRLVISTYKTGNHGGIIISDIKKTRGFAKTNSLLDVSQLTGSYYVRVHSSDLSGSVRDVQLYVYAINIYYKDGTVEDIKSQFTQSTFEKITVSNVNSSFVYSGKANKCLITCESGSVRFKTDGNFPTVSDGILLEVGDSLLLENNGDILRFNAVRTTETNGVLQAIFTEEF